MAEQAWHSAGVKEDGAIARGNGAVTDGLNQARQRSAGVDRIENNALRASGHSQGLSHGISEVRITITNLVESNVQWRIRCSTMQTVDNHTNTHFGIVNRAGVYAIHAFAPESVYQARHGCP
jgi:hypothetical protein